MTYTIQETKNGSRFSREGIQDKKQRVIDNLLDTLGLPESEEQEAQERLSTEPNPVYVCDKNSTTYRLIALPHCEVRIVEHYAGFGQYDTQESGENWADEQDLLDAMKSGREEAGETLLELGIDELPKGIEDIRGRIHNEPDRVFVILDEDGDLVGYAGIHRENE